MTSSTRILFVTGTDTGVGKTLLTAMLLVHLRRAGVSAFAMKPVCSGGRSDARLLLQLHEGELRLDDVNPFHFVEPLTPMLSARREGRLLQFHEVLRSVRDLAARCEILLVEGAGGLLSPLGEGFSALDLVGELKCETLIVTPNRLGTINHTLLTVRALQQSYRPHGQLEARCGTRKTTRGTGLPGCEPGVSAAVRLRIVLMGVRRSDPSSACNGLMLRELASRTDVLELPFLGGDASNIRALEKNAKNIHKTLAGILETSSV